MGRPEQLAAKIDRKGNQHDWERKRHNERRRRRKLNDCQWRKPKEQLGRRNLLEHRRTHGTTFFRKNNAKGRKHEQ